VNPDFENSSGNGSEGDTAREWEMKPLGLALSIAVITLNEESNFGIARAISNSPRVCFKNFKSSW
jgi:hypothetical protein